MPRFKSLKYTDSAADMIAILQRWSLYKLGICLVSAARYGTTCRCANLGLPALMRNINDRHFQIALLI